VVLANWLPEISPDFGSNPAPLIILMAVGFVVGVAGHLMKTRAAVIIGIGMIFLATFVLPLLANVLQD
jgi:hypothetical protein